MANLTSLIGGNGWDEFGEIAWRPASTTAAQSVTVDTITTLNIDTEILDTGNKVTIDGGNLFTLVAGTYQFDMFVPVNNVSGSGKSIKRIYNVTDGAVVIDSLTDVTSGEDSSSEFLSGVFVLSASKQLRLEFAYSDGAKTIGGFTGTDFSSVTDVTSRTRFRFQWRA